MRVVLVPRSVEIKPSVLKICIKNLKNPPPLVVEICLGPGLLAPSPLPLTRLLKLSSPLSCHSQSFMALNSKRTEQVCLKTQLPTVTLRESLILVKSLPTQV